MRNATCVRTQTSKDPTRVAILFISYSMAMELPSKKAKREHRFAKCVQRNVNVARKSGSHVMKSKTK